MNRIASIVDSGKEYRLSDTCANNGCKRKRASDSLSFCSKCRDSLKTLIRRMADIPLDD
jgi:hypothetical protein